MAELEFEAIAKVAHETIRAYKAILRQEILPSWSVAPDWMRTSTIEAVRFLIENRDAGAEEWHQQWLDEKYAAGWRLGPTRDADLKTHPMIVPYDQLPLAERRKDALIAAVVWALTTEV